jgi:hypothetical protein
VNTEDHDKLWRALDRRRGSAVDVAAIVSVAREIGVSLTADDLWGLAPNHEGLCPPRVARFVAELARDEMHDVVLDPSVGYGTLLGEVCAAVAPARVLARGRNQEALRVARGWLERFAPELASCDAYGEHLDVSEEVDLVVSAPPFHERPRRFDLDGTPIDDLAGNELLLRALRRTRSHGVGLFVVTPSFFLRRGGVRESLPALGFHLDAYFHLSPGHFAPLTNIPSGIAVVRRGPTPEHVFLASYVEDDAVRSQVLQRYRRREAWGGDPRLGTLVPLDELADMPVIEARANLARLAKGSALPKRRLADVAQIQRYEPSESMHEDDVVLPLDPRRPASVGTPPTKARAARLVVDPTQVLAPVLAEALNGELGHAARTAASGGSIEPSVPLGALAELPVWLPPLSHQERVVALDRRIRATEVRLRELRSELWSSLAVDDVAHTLDEIAREPTTADWIETLPFPLASVLWSAEAARTEPLVRERRLDHFFEALAGFLAVLLLSGCRSREAFWGAHARDLDRVLRQAGLSLTVSTYGAWKCVVEFLGKRLRDELRDDDAREVWRRAFAIDDPALLDALVSSEMAGLLQHMNKLRNRDRGHGGAAGERIVRARLREYEDALLRFRELVGWRWARAPLVRGKGYRLRGGRASNDVEFAMGTRIPFEQGIVDVPRALDEEYLHVVSPRDGSALTLLPMLHFGASPANETTACYFFNKVEPGGAARFVSYHFEERPEVRLPSEDIEHALGTLFEP